MNLNFKKLVSMLLAAVMVLAVSVVGVSAETPKYEQNKNWGDSDGDGVFEVATPEDLLAMAAKRVTNGQYAGKVIKLTADIDLNPGWDAASGTVPTNVWATMFRFDGTLDGQGHTIKRPYSTGDANGNTATFITNLVAGSIKNLRVENSVFKAAKNNAALVACVKNDSTMENVYVDAIVEAGGVAAGGLISWHYTSASASENPKSLLKGCVFAGSVSAKYVAGGLIGVVGSYPESGAFSVSKIYETTLIDCANYGSVSVGSEGIFAGGLVGLVPGKATFTRCYNAGTVAVASGTKAALCNVFQTAVSPVDIADCYALAASGLDVFTKNDAATSVALKYEGADATAAQTATAAELVEKTAFKGEKGWSIVSERALPAGVADMLRTHTYEAVVTPPTCQEKGYTTYTCKDAGCGATYVSDYTDVVAHTESDEWIVDKEPTVESAGSRHKECTVCGKTVKTEVLKKLTAEATEAPTAEETTPPATTTTAPAVEEEKGGCGSSVTAGLLGMTFLLAGAALSLRKKEN